MINTGCGDKTPHKTLKEKTDGINKEDKVEEYKMNKQITQHNFLNVLENIKQHYIDNQAPDNWDRETWIESFNVMLDELLELDFFGTEG